MAAWVGGRGGIGQARPTAVDRLPPGRCLVLTSWSHGGKRPKKSHLPPGCELLVSSDTLLAIVAHLGPLGHWFRLVHSISVKDGRRGREPHPGTLFLALFPSPLPLSVSGRRWTCLVNEYKPGVGGAAEICGHVELHPSPSLVTWWLSLLKAIRVLTRACSVGWADLSESTTPLRSMVPTPRARCLPLPLTSQIVASAWGPPPFLGALVFVL